jgi:hypothetical protein
MKSIDRFILVAVEPVWALLHAVAAPAADFSLRFEGPEVVRGKAGEAAVFDVYTVAQKPVLSETQLAYLPSDVAQNAREV